LSGKQKHLPPPLSFLTHYNPPHKAPQSSPRLSQAMAPRKTVHKDKNQPWQRPSSSEHPLVMQHCAKEGTLPATKASLMFNCGSSFRSELLPSALSPLRLLPLTQYSSKTASQLPRSKQTHTYNYLRNVAIPLTIKIPSRTHVKAVAAGCRECEGYREKMQAAVGLMH